MYWGFLVGFFFGLILSDFLNFLKKQISSEVELVVKVPADAELTPTLMVTRKDSKGNVVDRIPVVISRFEEIDPVGNWGTATFDEDEPSELDLRFQDAGSSVTIRVFTELNGEEKSIDFPLEIEAGAPVVEELEGELVVDVD
jgi:hypothetical protein